MKIKCFFNGVSSLVRCGEWIPHVYKTDSPIKTNIIATENSFRYSDSFQHNCNETVFPNCYLIKSECVNCGKVDYSWCKPELLREVYDEIGAVLDK